MDDHAAPPEDGIAPPLLPLWKNPDYILLWCGQLISSIGTSTSQLAYSLLVLLLTNSPAQAGLVSAFSLVPYFVFGLPIGALVDRWNRKMTMIVCDVGRGLCMGSITLALVLGWLTVVQLYIVALVDGVFFVFFNVAQVASLPRIMPEEQLPVAVAQNDGIDKIAPVIGSFLGGSLFAVLRMLPFLLDMLSYMVSAVTLFFIKASFQEERLPSTWKLYQQIAEGLIWFWRQPLLRFMAFFDSAAIATVSGVTPLVVILIAQRHGASPAVIGLILACGGLGGSLGVLCTRFFLERFNYSQIIIGCGWVWLLLWLGYLLLPNALILGGIVLGLYFTVPWYSAYQMGNRIRMTPDYLQGRVNSIHRLTNFACKALGSTIIGMLIQWIGLEPALLIFAGWFTFMALAATVNKQVRSVHYEIAK